MAMHLRHMFGALAVSAAAAMLAACGDKVPTQDPSVTATQPAAPPQIAAKANLSTKEPLTANTYYDTSLNTQTSTSTPVEGIEACLNSAKEATYMASKHMIGSGTATSCVGKDGIARARFGCSRTDTGAIACRPF